MKRPSDVSLMPGTRVSIVAEELRRMIVAGELAGGERLRQAEIAERFGVSTTPVREAFTALARAGLVRQDAHRGVIVFTPSLEDLRENYEIRGVLEPLATERAAGRISTADVEVLRGIAAEMKVNSAEHRGQVNDEVLNPRFHAMIYAAAGRPRLAEMIKTLRDGALAYHSLMTTRDPSDGYAELAHGEHEEIVNALAARDGRRAAATMRAHIDNNMHRVLSSLPDLIVE